MDKTPGSPWKGWVSPDGLVGVEIDLSGCWVRTREHPADTWSPPEQMDPSGGQGKLEISLAGIARAS